MPNMTENIIWSLWDVFDEQIINRGLIMHHNKFPRYEFIWSLSAG